MADFPAGLSTTNSLLVAKDFVSDPLRAAMTSVQVTVPVTDATKFPNPAGNIEYVVLESASSALREIVGYTGLDLTVSANALTGVTRGLFGTTAQAHLLGITCELNVMSQYHERLKAEVIAIQTKVGADASATTTTFDYKLAQVTGGDRAVGLAATQTLANKTLTLPVIASLSNGGTVTIPAGTDTLVNLVGTQTLANKTLTLPVIASISNGGTVTIPAGTDTIVTLTATQTLTNKTLTSPTLSGASFSGGITVTTGNVSITAGNITFGAAAAVLIPGVTSFSLRNNANTADNILVTDAGGVTVRSTLTVTAGASVNSLTVTTGGANITGTITSASGITVSAGGLAVTGATTLTTGLTVSAGGASIAGGLTVSSGNFSITAGAMVFNGTSQYIVAPITSLLITNHANTVTNFSLTDAGALTIQAGITVTTGGLTVSAGGLTVTAGGANITGTLTSASGITVSAGGLTVSAGGASITGILTAASGLTVSSGNLTVSGGNAIISAGNLTFSAAASQVVPGTTSLSFRNNANTADNLIVSDAGVTTSRAGVVITTGGLSVTAGGITVSAGAVALGPGAVTGSTYNAQTISSAASFTGTVAIATGLTVAGNDIATSRVEFYMSI